MARALAAHPYLLLLDEVLAGLNHSEIDSMIQTVLKIREQGITIIMIEHVMKAVMNVSDRIIVLDYGEQIAEGTPQEIANNPRVIEAYLGDPHLASQLLEEESSWHPGSKGHYLRLWRSADSLGFHHLAGGKTDLPGRRQWRWKNDLAAHHHGAAPPWSGTVWFEGKDVSRLPAHTKADMGLVLVPEGRQLFTDMTVYENLEMGAIEPARPAKVATQSRTRLHMFPRLKERSAQKAGTLSGGEQQMLAVARGIMAEPKVLMIDELSLGLAPVLVLQLFESLKQLREQGLTILLVEQNVQMALAISDYGYVLSEGKVELEGPPRQLIKDPHVRAAYLGL